ncbi:MAG: putative toxin-antitoxin system toxin component, PIN family [Oscillospiraceae bacterium]|jgi:putative PIN family toxin of toxin-antitoxin system|nr:putative toxin-antitoxin system toxin component, PIN family [Oscillospiraceae bacterium]
MKCFIDSNILISAGLFPNSIPAAAIAKAVAPPNTAIVSDYSLDEVHRIINKKFPDRIKDLELFLYRTLFLVQLVTTPADALDVESEIRDIKDRPIFRAALEAGADVLITGDKDLLESGITHPQILKPAEFVNMR